MYPTFLFRTCVRLTPSKLARFTYKTTHLKCFFLVTIFNI